MSSMKVLERILSASMSEDIKKHRKKKAKKAKRKKMDQEILRAKNEQWMKDYAEFCESAAFTQRADVKKEKKRKKKPEDTLSEAFQPPLKPPRKKQRLKRHQQRVDGGYARHMRSVSEPSLGEQKQTQAGFGQSFESLTQKDEVQNKKRVTFSLSPVLIPPKPPRSPFAVSDKTQRSGADKPASVNTQGKSFYKLSVEENPTESQSTAEDFSSQDLFITQRSLLDHYAEIRSSAGTDPARRTYRPSSQDKPASRHKPEASTQTENFFTAPALATSVRMCRRRTCGEEPLDLSLPSRIRVCRPELKREQTSSDDGDAFARSKPDLSHLKVVQTRLNESFFFKVKGDVESPNPMSPLMRLTGSVEKK